MKVIIILAILVQFNQGFQFKSKDDDVWNEFKVQYQKTYRNELHESQKKTIFINNLRMIEEFNSQKHSYEQGINEFTDMSYEETMDFLGIGGGIMPIRKTLKSSNFTLPKDTPKSLDWRDFNGENYVTRVRKQGRCSSWWAISAVGTLESLFYIKGKVDELTELSVQEVIDCGRKSCRGGLVDDAFLYILENGIVPEKNYRYHEKAHKCNVNHKKSVGRIRGMEIVMTENEVINALVKIGPVSVYTCLPRTFVKYQKGIYNDPSCNPSPDAAFCQNFQAMNLVGYGTEDGVDYWIVKNSWGRWWGEKGYIRIARANERCWISFYARYPIL